MAVIAQRLIAAGASPERARAFEQQYTQRLQGAQPGLTRPQDIQDAFDAEIAAFAAAAYPNVFRPPTIDDPRIDAYITGIYGPNKLQELENKAYTEKAPNFFRIQKSLPKDPNAYNLDQYIIAAIQNGQPYAQIVNDIIEKAPIELMGSLTEGKVADVVNKYYNEYNDAQTSIPTYKQKLLDTNKYYKVGLPDPSFEYAEVEDLAARKIAFTTHPSVTRILESPEAKRAPAIARTAPSSYMVDPKNPQASIAAFDKMRTEAAGFEDRLLNDLRATGATPFRDEVKRREYLKKRTTK